jgi:hypothetical protein
MKANELRIGNYIADRGNKEWQIDHWESINKLSAKSNATMCMGILMETHPMTEYVDYIKPIPLTEEWLLKFGFTHQYKTKKGQDFFDRSINSEFQLYVNLNDSRVSINKKYVGNVYSKKIQYLHQLQNLYFALTGEELTIKGVTND